MRDAPILYEVPIKAFLGDVCYVRPGVIDEAAVDVFTNGQCHSLAVALSRRLGYPLFLIVAHSGDLEEYLDEQSNLREEYTELPDEVVYNLWMHALVQVDNEKDIFLDITGLHSGSELCAEWGWGSSPADPRRYFVSSNEEQIARLVSRYGGIELDVEVADTFVDELRARYLDSDGVS